MVICSRSSGGTGSPSFLAPLLVAGVAYLVAIREFFHTAQYSRRVIFACLALAVLWQISFLMMPPGADDDIRRYFWDGRIQRLGYNPYEVVPSDPALAALHTPETRGLNNPEVSSPYPAGAQLFFRAVTAIHESIFAFKIAFVALRLRHRTSVIQPACAATAKPNTGSWPTPGTRSSPPTSSAAATSIFSAFCCC